MRPTAKESYAQAYHRIRTLNSSQLIWDGDTYPTGYDCRYYHECDRDNHYSCACAMAENERHTAHRETLKEAQRLLTERVRGYDRFAAKSYADRLNHLDHWGHEIELTMIPNYQLWLKLNLAKKRGVR